MRLLVINYEYPPLGGGAAPVTAALASELARRGHELDVVTMGYRDLPRFEQAGGLRVHRVHCRRSKAEICSTSEMATYLLPAYRHALKLARQQPYDLIHGHFILPSGLVAVGLKRALGLPLLISSHGSDVPGYNPNRFTFEHRLIKPLWHRLVRHMDVLVSPSAAFAELIRSNLPSGEIANRINVVPYGLSPFGYDPSLKVSRRVLMSGRLLERKGFRTMLQAMALEPLDIELHILGDGPERQVLESMASTLSTPITFHGWLDNTSDQYRDLFRTSSIFVFPSRMESFGMVLAEAMGAGMAILTTTSGGCGEVVGDTAEIIPADDPQTLARKLRGLLDAPQRVQQMGHAAYQRVLSKFTWSAVADQYEALFAELRAHQGAHHN